LLPKAIIEELASLQEKVTPLTEEEVVAVMERELGVPWETCFGRSILIAYCSRHDRPGASRHARVGERVVVKVQRPTAQRDIALDLGLLERLAAKMAARSGSHRVIDVPLLIRQFSESLRRGAGLQT
jgi:ubiquinone biosynthesis protein